MSLAGPLCGGLIGGDKSVSPAEPDEFSRLTRGLPLDADSLVLRGFNFGPEERGMDGVKGRLDPQPIELRLLVEGRGRAADAPTAMATCEAAVQSWKMGKLVGVVLGDRPQTETRSKLTGRFGSRLKRLFP